MRHLTKCQIFGKARAPPCATRSRWRVDRAERTDRARFLIPLHLQRRPPSPPPHLPDSTSPPSRPGHDEAAGPLRSPSSAHRDWSNVLFTRQTSATYPQDMAPGVRSGQAGHPGVLGGAGGGCTAHRRDPGGEGRCLRSRWRAEAAGMLASCLLSAGMLSLLVRCAVAAEGKITAPNARWLVALRQNISRNLQEEWMFFCCCNRLHKRAECLFFRWRKETFVCVTGHL